jgi:magnesium-transporting ATPase (P-type)
MTEAFWTNRTNEVLEQLRASPRGLTSDEAQRRLRQFGLNRLKPKTRTGSLALLLSQFKSPIILILIFAAVLSFFLHDPVDASIILAIVAVSGLLGFWQENGAVRALEKLLAIVQVTAKVVRDGHARELPVEEIVPGDVVELSAGDMIPGDCLLLEAQDLYGDEATLTGETYPVEKSPGAVGPDMPLGKRHNTLFMGTHVISGTGKAVVVHTGPATEFGKVSERLKLRPPETDFERGVRRFGYLLTEVTLVIVMAIFAFNVYFHRPVLGSFLFALALAVGLTPQLLPVIISVNLAHGARRTFANTLKYVFMATSANFGNMFSMAGASLVLPFLPMLPKQILLMNLLTDLPELAIATDSVDEELVEKPQRWDIGFIRRFMIWFGLLSSMFDYLTFGVLWFLGVTPEQFRMGWFVESVVSASLIVLVVRSRRPFFRSRPSRYLLWATLAVVAATLVLPITPLATVFEFALLPPRFLPVVAGIVAGYVASAELIKRFFYARLVR